MVFCINQTHTYSNNHTNRIFYNNRDFLQYLCYLNKKEIFMNDIKLHGLNAEGIEKEWRKVKVKGHVDAVIEYLNAV